MFSPVVLDSIFGQGHFDSFITDALSLYRSKLVERIQTGLGIFQNVLDQTTTEFYIMNHVQNG